MNGQQIFARLAVNGHAQRAGECNAQTFSTESTRRGQGGKARAKSLDAARRTEIARKAAKGRWKRQ
jgi:hypothetical protein